MRVANNADAMSAETTKASFHGAVQCLAAELFNPATPQLVRKNVQSNLQYLGQRMGKEVTELLEKVHVELLRPLLARALRTKQTELQVGDIYERGRGMT